VGSILQIEYDFSLIGIHLPAPEHLGDFGQFIIKEIKCFKQND
jgi:hypothetical protein